jgi:hypothetical protein
VRERITTESGEDARKHPHSRPFQQSFDHDSFTYGC